MELSPFDKLLKARELLKKYDDEFFPSDKRPTKIQMQNWEKGRKPFEKAVSNASAILNESRKHLTKNGLADFMDDPEA